jgi:benzoyl-CoA reductase subunit D
MLKLGVDVGAANTKVAIMDDGRVLAVAGVATGFDQQKSAETAIGKVLQKVGKTMKDISRIRATGVGRKAIPDITTDEIDEFDSAAKGTLFFLPSARTVIDVGAEEGRAVKIDSAGKILDFAVNEKCAAGAGSFVEAMATALEIPSPEELGKISLQSNKKIPMNAQCVIFAESEVVSLIAAGTEKADISKAIHDSIADRIGGMTRRAGLEKDIVLIGGVAKNVGFVESLKKSLNMDILVPTDPEYVSAVGAAVSA